MKLKLQKLDRACTLLSRKRAQRTVNSRTKKRCRLSGKYFNKSRQTARISVPFALSIESKKNRKQFTKFMSELRKELLELKNKVILDFSETQIILPAAMLLIIAEVDRAKRLFKEDFSVSISNIKDKTVKQVLVQIGFYQLCNLTPPKLDQHQFNDNVKHWKYATGERADDATSDAFSAIEGLICSKLRGGMWKGVSEAVINSVQHAYAAPRGTPGPEIDHKRWWMFSEERDGALTVAVCDLGIGIPRSLPLNWDESLISRLTAPFTDGGTDVAALRASLQLGRSSTGEQHRGKGLPQIWAAVQGDERSGILIHSNRARLSWSGKENAEFSTQYDDSIFGTVIMWQVPVEEERD